jgi:hypothetical protein
MRTSMTGHRISAAILAAAFATLTFAQPAHAAPYDGSWNMMLVTTKGHCGKIRIGVAVNRGQISATSGRFVMHKVHLNGQIGGGGQTIINGVAGPRQAKGVGRFSRAQGTGKWNGTGPSGVCHGYWVAHRA